MKLRSAIYFGLSILGGPGGHLYGIYENIFKLLNF